jgi:hypothetical protein
MLIRLPIRDISKWGSNIYSYSKLSVHPLLNVVVDSSTIKLSGMPYVSVRVLLKSKDLVVNTPYIDFDDTDWDTYKLFSVSGSGTLYFSDDYGIIIPSSTTISGGQLITVAGNQLVVGGVPVVI